MPPEDERARYIQVYFLDTLEDQLRARGEHQNMNADILERITAWLNENNQYDLAISAEISDKEQDKELHDLVMKHMIHGPK